MLSWKVISLAFLWSTSTILSSPTGFVSARDSFPDDGIHPNTYIDKCLAVKNHTFASQFQNGMPVDIADCGESGTATQWIIHRGLGRVVLLDDTNYCLDAGSNPANGVELKIWQCYDDLPAQTWYYTDDQRIALADQGFCVDLADGDVTNGNKVQIWKCTDFNTNQIWNVGDGNPF